MIRKVIQIADSTQLVSLPRKWCVAHGIKKGDELEVREQDNQVIVSTSKDLEVNKCTLDLTKQSKLRKRTVCAAYLKGYDEVEIIYPTPDYIQVVQKILPEFAGYEIVKQDKNKCVIKQISKPTAEEFESVSNRLFLLLHDTLQTIADGLLQNDIEHLKGIQYREMNINKFANFCLRIINKGTHNLGEKSCTTYFIIQSLEFLGDECKEISNYLLKTGKLDKKLGELLSQINNLYEGVYKFYKTQDRTKASENAILYDKLAEQIETMFQGPKADQFIYRNVSRIIQIIAEIQQATLLITV